ncbi:MAG TPA: hydroxyacid dehydrogenase [Acidisphaera sp.]|nr:hydroxyacid dehydrogenase [Acidisphaera sp.]
MSHLIFLAHTPDMRRNYYGDEALAGLRALGPVRLHEGTEALDGAGLVAAARGARVIVADRMTAGPAEVFAGLPELVAFVRVAVDIRNIDVEAASAAGVLVTRAGPGFVDSVVELTLGLMIDLSRGISRAVRDYQAGRMPAAPMGRQLSGATMGVIGYGSIGRHLAPLGVALGMTVLVADPYATVDDPTLRQLTLDALLAQSDYVVCLAVATEETENLIDSAAFARMKPGAFFVNVSRGNLVDETALEAALRSGRIGGAGLDVGRAPDQMPSPHIAVLPGVVATPHIGGLTPQAIGFQALGTVRQVAAILNGEVPPGAVNAERWTRRLT